MLAVIAVFTMHIQLQWDSSLLRVVARLTAEQCFAKTDKRLSRKLCVYSVLQNFILYILIYRSFTSRGDATFHRPERYLTDTSSLISSDTNEALESPRHWYFVVCYLYASI